MKTEYELTQDPDFIWVWSCGYLVGWSRKRSGVHLTYKVMNRDQQIVAAGTSFTHRGRWNKAHKEMCKHHYAGPAWWREKEQPFLEDL